MTDNVLSTLYGIGRAFGTWESDVALPLDHYESPARPGMKRHRMFLDFGSLFNIFGDEEDDAMVAKLADSLTVLQSTCRKMWHWRLHDETMFEGERATDVRRILYVSFDDSDDAMLSKMALQDLKDIRHAHYRGLPRKA